MTSVLRVLGIVLLFSVVISVTGGSVQYQPTWESLDSRPLPQWYDESKFGIFIHWGLFSVPSFGNEWFWWFWKGDSQEKYVNFMNENYSPNFQYPDFTPGFTAQFFNETKWAQLFKNSGARYVVLTSKHHEGFTMWPSKYSWNWNSQNLSPHTDIIGRLSKAIREETDLRFGLYYSLFEWFNPLYLADKQNNFTTQDYVNDILHNQLYEIIEGYRPEVLWSDGEWEASDEYWGSKDFLSWLYNESPVRDVIVTNDRWGTGTLCKHGGYYTCHDRYNPGVLQKHKWENCMTIDRESWGFRREADISDYLSTKEIITQLVTTVSCGGNLLLNVGPTKDGIIAPIFEERLLAMGDWLSVNGEAIYNTTPWRFQNDSSAQNVWYTATATDKTITVYAISLQLPTDGILTFTKPKPTKTTSITLLGYNNKISWSLSTEGDISIDLDSVNWLQIRSGLAWVFKLVDVI